MSANLDVELPRFTPEGWTHQRLRGLAGPAGLALIFWSAVCSHCRRYDQSLGAWRHRGKIGLAVVGCRDNESPETLADAVRSRGLDFTLLHDRKGELAARWGARQTPTVFLLDAAEEVVYRGAIDDFTYPDAEGHRPYLDDAARAVIDGRPVPIDATPAFGCPTRSVYYGGKKLVPGIG